MTIANKLQSVLATKEGIKTSLINKGADMTAVPFTQYPMVIDGLQFLPIGSIVDYRLNQSDPNFLECDGGLIAELDYPELAVLLEGTHGAMEYVDFVNTVSGTPPVANTGYGAAFSPDGQFLAVAHWNWNEPYLTVIRTSDWTVVDGTPALAGAGRDVAFSPDGQFLAVAHQTSPALTVIRTSDWTVVSGTPTLAGTSVNVAFGPDGQFLSVGQGSTPFLTVINATHPIPAGYFHVPKIPNQDKVTNIRPPVLIQAEGI